MRPRPGTSTRRCCPCTSGSWAPSTPETLTTRANLAYFTGMAGDAGQEQSDLYTRCCRCAERVSGPEHRDTLAARDNLAYWTGPAGDAAGNPDLAWSRSRIFALKPAASRAR